jgi:hypothetical protein
MRWAQIRVGSKQKGGLSRVRPFATAFCMQRFAPEARLLDAMLFGGQFFLFAFHAHRFELALFGVVRFLHFLLDLRCRFFQLG